MAVRNTRPFSLCVGWILDKIGRRRRCNDKGIARRISGETGGYILVLCDKCAASERSRGWTVTDVVFNDKVCKRA